MMRRFFKVFVALCFGISSVLAQNLEKTWQFESIKDSSGNSLFNIVESDTISFSNGKFDYSLNAKDQLKASGDYLHQNNVLVLYYTQP